MQSFDPYSGNTNTPKPSKPIIVIGSLVVIVAILICVSMKLKASTPHNPTPNPALIQQASTSQLPAQPQTPTSPSLDSPPAAPTETTPSSSKPTATTDQTTDTTPDTSSDQSSDTTSDQSSDQTTDPAPDQPSGPQLASMTISPGSVYVGTSFEIEVTLDAPAPPGGASVSLSMGDAAQDPIEIPEGSSSGSTSFSAPDSSGTDTFTCTYGGVTYNTDLTVMDLKDCADTYDDDDDTPCIGVDGDTTTRGEWKYRQEQQLYYAQREQEQVHEETGSGN